MRLYILGSGCPAPLPDWYGSSFILEIGSDALMIDCGPAATYKMVRMGINPTKVERLFLTHHHFDHNCDLPCFALTRWDQSAGRPPLKVYGPAGTRRLVDGTLGEAGAFFDDWNSRVNTPVSQELHRMRGGTLPRPEPKVEVKEICSGSVTEGEGWLASATGVRHVQPWLESLAYRFDTDEGSVVFAGDCADCGELRRIAKGADVLVMACAYIGRSEANAELAEVITGTPEAAEIGRAAGVRRLVLTHVSPAFAKAGVREQAIAEISRTFDGEVVLPNELTTLDLSD